jgi:hypothetical protein
VTAPVKFLDRVRSIVDREGRLSATGVRRDSTVASFECRRADSLLLVRFAPFRETLEVTGFPVFAFKRIDLEATDARPAGFFTAFVFGFAFVAIRAGTYTVNTS